MKKIFQNFLWVNFLFMFLLHKTNAQANLKYWTSGLYVSSQIHSGFISEGAFRFTPTAGFGVSLKNSYFNRVHIGIDVGYIHLRNTYALTEQTKWGLSVSNIEILPNLEFNFRLFGKYLRDKKWTPYFKIAPSFNVFQSSLKDVQNFTNEYEFFPYSYLSTGWFMAVGYKYRTKKDYLLQVEVFVNNMLTNKASGFTIEDAFIYDRYIGVRLGYSFIKF